MEVREFQRQGAEMRKEWLENLSLDVRSERPRYSDERVLPDGLIFMRVYQDIMVRKNAGDYDCIREMLYV